VNKLFVSFLIICFILFSCNKNKISNDYSAIDYSGIYDCLYISSWFDISDPNGSGDTTYQTTLEVFQSGDIITVNGFDFHCDSLANENSYTDCSFSYGCVSLMFYSQDSIYYHSQSDGNGGGYSHTYYGRKI
jgi:hypothetical protein